MKKIATVLSSVIILSTGPSAFSQISGIEYCSVSAVRNIQVGKIRVSGANLVVGESDKAYARDAGKRMRHTSNAEVSNTLTTPLTAIDFIVAGAANYAYVITASNEVALSERIDNVMADKLLRIPSLSRVLNSFGSEQLSVWALPVIGGTSKANIYGTHVPVTINYN